MSARFDPGGYAAILDALRNDNVGLVLTVWAKSEAGEAGYRVWRPLDDEYSRRDAGYIMGIPLTEICADVAAITAGQKDGEQIPVECVDAPFQKREG